MRQTHTQAGQQQAPATEQFLKQAVVAAFAVGRITDDRMRKVLQMAPQLMPPAGFRRQFE